MTNWNDSFAGDEYRYGREPALFLSERRSLFQPGQTALSICDGEGRNSVFLAEQGLDVVAWDGAPNAVAKAEKLAAERGVAVDYRIATAEAYAWDARQYDVVLAIFIQFAGPELRKKIFRGMVAALKPGGLLLLHGYATKQLDYGTGGPKAFDQLYDEALLRRAFADLEIMELNAYDRDINEGPGHRGMSALIDLMARKPA